jgi:hypothetical protein
MFFRNVAIHVPNYAASRPKINLLALTSFVKPSSKKYEAVNIIIDRIFTEKKFMIVVNDNATVNLVLRQTMMY